MVGRRLASHGFHPQKCVNPSDSTRLAIPAFRAWRQENHKFGVIFKYVVNLRPPWDT